MVKNAVEIWR